MSCRARGCRPAALCPRGEPAGRRGRPPSPAHGAAPASTSTCIRQRAPGRPLRRQIDLFAADRPAVVKVGLVAAASVISRRSSAPTSDSKIAPAMGPCSTCSSLATPVSRHSSPESRMWARGLLITRFPSDSNQAGHRKTCWLASSTDTQARTVLTATPSSRARSEWLSSVPLRDASRASRRSNPAGSRRWRAYARRARDRSAGTMHTRSRGPGPDVGGVRIRAGQRPRAYVSRSRTGGTGLPGSRRPPAAATAAPRCGRQATRPHPASGESSASRSAGTVRGRRDPRRSPSSGMAGVPAPAGSRRVSAAADCLRGTPWGRPGPGDGDRGRRADMSRHFDPKTCLSSVVSALAGTVTMTAGNCAAARGEPAPGDAGIALHAHLIASVVRPDRSVRFALPLHLVHMPEGRGQGF